MPFQTPPSPTVKPYGMQQQRRRGSMGCIKPPNQVSQPTSRAHGRLAFTSGSTAADQALGVRAATEDRFADAKQAVQRAARKVSKATTTKAVDRALAEAKASLEVAMKSMSEKSHKQSLGDRMRSLEKAAADAKARLGISQWVPKGSQPPDVGVIINEDGRGHLVSFKVGKSGGLKDGHTLIADGDFSGDPDAFGVQQNHNHYGPDSNEPGETFAEDRGAYTGPDH